MKHRYKFFSIFTTFQVLLKTQYSAIIKYFQCDLSGEYTFDVFSDLLALDRAIQQTICSNTLKQNGVAKKEYRHLFEIVRSLLLPAFTFSEVQGETILTAAHLIERILTSYNSGLSPFEKLYETLL